MLRSECGPGSRRVCGKRVMGEICRPLRACHAKRGPFLLRRGCGMPGLGAPAPPFPLPLPPPRPLAPVPASPLPLALLAAAAPLLTVLLAPPADGPADLAASHAASCFACVRRDKAAEVVSCFCRRLRKSPHWDFADLRGSSRIDSSGIAPPRAFSASAADTPPLPGAASAAGAFPLPFLSASAAAAAPGFGAEAPVAESGVAGSMADRGAGSVPSRMCCSTCGKGEAECACGLCARRAERAAASLKLCRARCRHEPADAL